MKLLAPTAIVLIAAASTHRRVDGFSVRMSMAPDYSSSSSSSFLTPKTPSKGNQMPPPLRVMASPPPGSPVTAKASHQRSARNSSSSTDSTLAFRLSAAAASLDQEYETAASTPKKTKTLGLLTFDLDDSLYPVAPVLDEANNEFVRTMARYGYENIRPSDIVDACTKIREDAGLAGTAMSHTEVRLLAIRREMETRMIEKKLQACAQEWATEVESLTGPVRKSAEKWAKVAVHQSVVDAVYSAWERERHHSSERHLYPEVVSVLEQIKQRHPDVIIGAVTDGKANPMLMVFSLAPYFDFCMSWEDDAAGRTEFFKELGSVDGNADLQWIYTAAYERYMDIAKSHSELRTKGDDGEGEEGSDGPVWIHVGDDLAYDVGGSAACGAQTILLDLDEEYNQTAKLRFLKDGQAVNPSWNTALEDEISNRRAMNIAAESHVDKCISRLTLLPDVIEDMLKGE